jgi:hypothetical protein
MYLILIICKSREREAILDELEDWKGKGATILLSGITNKANDGFIFLKWDKPVPELFHLKMKEDGDILDYIAFGKNVPPTISQSVNGKG